MIISLFGCEIVVCRDLQESSTRRPVVHWPGGGAEDLAGNFCEGSGGDAVEGGDAGDVAGNVCEGSGGDTAKGGDASWDGDAGNGTDDLMTLTSCRK